MENLLQLFGGAALAGVFILFANSRGPRQEPVIYAVGLVVAALLYLAFSVTAASATWLLIELVGVGVFTLIALLGLRVSAWFLVFGWTAHVAWDVWLHLIRQQAFVPNWYPVFCISFDLIVAGTIAVRLRKLDGQATAK